MAGEDCAMLRAQEEAVFCFPKLHNYELATIQTKMFPQIRKK